MTDEMRAAESLVRALAPSGHDVPIPEPLAVDESRWFVRAVEKGLVEFTRCDESCTQHARGPAARGDHFRTGADDPHHLFAAVGDTRVALRREYLPAIAAWARAVLELGYAAEHGTLLRQRPVQRRLVDRFSPATLTIHAEFTLADGGTQLLIDAKSDRRLTRRVATALDACGSLRRLRPEIALEVERVTLAKPKFLWLVGPNTIEPESHVFRVDADTDDDDIRFERVVAVPVPV